MTNTTTLRIGFINNLFLIKMIGRLVVVGKQSSNSVGGYPVQKVGHPSVHTYMLA